ncbi:hypothetical protein TrVFT333_011082 [Trichoderma virens FT-333]|nr:hypothetical protein TrVFT333_011082 [Trichoderma virens FT-333]
MALLKSAGACLVPPKAAKTYMYLTYRLTEDTELFSPDPAFFRTGPPYWIKAPCSSPRKPQLFVTQPTSPASHCQSLQQQTTPTPRLDHLPSPSVHRIKSLYFTASPPSSPPACPSSTAKHQLPLASAYPIQR